jgi:hypothetical protein
MGAASERLAVSTIKVTKAAGLFTSDNPYGSTPEGSFATADNVVIRNKDVVEPIRGYEKLTYSFTDSLARGKSLGFFGTTPIINTYDATTYKLARDTGSALTNYTGTYIPPDAATLRMKFTEAQQNLFFTTSVGVKSLDATTSTPTVAGLYRPRDIYTNPGETALTGNPGATGAWLPVDSAVAFAFALGRKDATGRVKWSAPSGRSVIVNPPDVVASLTRNGANVVTATVASHQFLIDDTFTVSPGAGTFGTGPFIVTATTATTFTYTEAGVAAGPLAAQTISSGLKKPRLIAPVTSAYVAGDFIRIFRSETSPTAAIDPGAELFLIHEGVLDAASISAGYYNVASAFFVDSTPESVLGSVPLYTNENTGDGIAQANFQPPIAKDLAVWQERQWFANTTCRHRYEFQMLGVGSPDGVQIGDTLTLGDRTFTFLDPTTLSSTDDAPVFSGGAYPENVRLTSQHLVGSVTLTGASTAWAAFYISSQDDAPGRILLEEAAIGGSTGYISASRPASWSPVPATTYAITEASSSRTSNVVTITTGSSHGFSVGQVVYLHSNAAVAAFAVGSKTITATPSATTFTYAETGANATMSGTYTVSPITTPTDNETAINRLYYSKLQQPEAVPLVNYLDVGSKTYGIQRIIPLRDKLFVFKADGIFTVSGEAPFRVDLLDNTARLVAPDSVVVVSNRIFALTTQGVVSITEGGVGIVSRSIENDIMPLVSTGDATFKAACFGVAYESDRSYLLWMPETYNSSSCTQAYIYNILSNTWTRRTDTQGHVLIHPTLDTLYLASTSAASLYVERKAFTAADYSYDSFTVTGNSVDQTAGTITLASASGVSVGDAIISSTSVLVTVTAINSNTLTVTSGTLSSFVGTNTVYKGFQCTLVYNANTAGAPGINKQFREFSTHFGLSDFDLGYMTSKTDVSESATSDLIATAVSATAATPKTFRKLIPIEKQRAGQLSVGFSLRQARARWRLMGHSIEADGMSERTVK